MKTELLGDLVKSVDYGVTASATREPVGPKFLRITDIQDDRVDWEEVPWCKCGEREAAASALAEGDIVFARTGATTGKSFLLKSCPSRSVFASYLIRVRLGNRADPGYIAHYFRSADYWEQIGSAARGAAQPGVNATVLRSLKVPLPPIEDQRRIAAILDKADELRAKRRAALAHLDSLTQAIFLDMFGDPRTNSRGLGSRAIGDVVRLKSGEGLTAARMASDGPYPVFGGNGVAGHHDEYMFEEPKVVIGRVGAYCGCVHVTPAKAWVSDNALYVSAMDEGLDLAYLAQAFVVANLNQYASQFGQPLVSGSRLYPVQILVPSIEEQREFALRAQSVRSIAENLSQGATLARELIASLHQQAFSGAL